MSKKRQIQKAHTTNLFGEPYLTRRKKKTGLDEYGNFIESKSRRKKKARLAVYKEGKQDGECIMLKNRL